MKLKPNENDRILAGKIVFTIQTNYNMSVPALENTIAQYLADQREEIEKREYIAGVLYAVQQLVLSADLPTIAADYIVQATGIGKDEFITTQKQSGHENKKMMNFIKEAFADER